MTDQIEGSIGELAVVMAVGGSVFGIFSWAAFKLMDKLTTPSATPSLPLFTLDNMKHALKILGYTIAGALLLGKTGIEKSFSALWAVTTFSARVAMNIAHFMAPHGIMQFFENRDVHSMGNLIGYCSHGAFSFLNNITSSIYNTASDTTQYLVSTVKDKISSSLNNLYSWAIGSGQGQTRTASNTAPYLEDGEESLSSDDDSSFEEEENQCLVHGQPFRLAHLIEEESLSSDDDSSFEEAQDSRSFEPVPIAHYNLRPR